MLEDDAPDGSLVGVGLWRTKLFGFHPRHFIKIIQKRQKISWASWKGLIKVLSPG
jgi:hypothetical protein